MKNFLFNKDSNENKNNNLEIKKKPLVAVIVILLIAIVALGIIMQDKNKEYETSTINTYNMAFYELVSYVENVETYLAKSTISKTSEHGAETLTHLWREANLAQTYLAMLPIDSNELENTYKFLNQVSDYSYTLSMKSIYNEDLTQEELDTLEELHLYSIELENTLNQLASDLSVGNLSWSELTSETESAFSVQVDNISLDSFSSLEENFHEYSGLIYDGAFSEHLTGTEAKAIEGEEISQDEAENKIKEFLGESSIKEITFNGLSENTSIPAYDFSIISNNDENINISISKQGGYIIYMNSDKDVNLEILTVDESITIAKEYLESHGFSNMEETYYIKQEGIITINFAYSQDGVIMYSDLIKIKVALDDGTVLGLETTGYLNNHVERELTENIISVEEAKENLNEKLSIESEGLAVIPTEWQTEIYCYEFIGKVDDTEFLVYINAESGKEEDILVIKDTPNGVLTM